MAVQSFAQHLLSATFVLANGTFAESGTDTLTLAGLKMSARVYKAQALSGCRLDLDIFGMTFSQMNDLSTLGMQIRFLSGNQITLKAGDAVNGANSVVFNGIILDAYANFDDMPNVVFSIRANSIGGATIFPAQPTSYPGPTVSVATAFNALATAGGFSFENNGVTAMISGPLYLYGSLADQMNALAEKANISWAIDDTTVAIWPKDGSRTTNQTPLINQSSGLIGWPGYTTSGILLKTLFNPAIKFQGSIQVQSTLFTQAQAALGNKPPEAANFFPANGIWAVSELDHYLDTKTIGGDWKSIIMAYNPQYGPPGVAPAVLPSP